MRAGSLFSGIGGLDIACEWAFGASTVWQLDLVGEAIRRRHFPDALQVTADVATVDPLGLPPIDVLCAGFSCQDLSCAGKGGSRDDLDAGDKTGPTYRGVIRFVEALRPAWVVLENVPAVLKHRDRIETDLQAAGGARGYGVTWVKARALDAGAPHIRRRVFAVAELGGTPGGVVDADRAGMWTSEGEQAWQTPRASEGKIGGWSSKEATRKSPSLGFEVQVRPWATPTVNESGTGRRGPGAGRGSCPGDESISGQVRPLATPRASEERASASQGTVSLGRELRRSEWGRRLSPDWIETLMGYPVGWTLPTGPALAAEGAPAWPRGRYPATWDRATPWPGYAWEPPRTLPDGPPCPGRPARIRGLGNAVNPQSGALAIGTALRPPQPSLFG
jgi:DNA (cytosine-5)-methyltransferase 1